MLISGKSELQLIFMFNFFVYEEYSQGQVDNNWVGGGAEIVDILFYCIRLQIFF